jgi:hypothetical protein
MPGYGVSRLVDGSTSTRPYQPLEFDEFNEWSPYYLELLSQLLGKREVLTVLSCRIVLDGDLPAWLSLQAQEQAFLTWRRQ